NRLIPAPVPAGNYKGLRVSDKALFWLSFAAGEDKAGTVQAVAIDHEDPEVKTVADKVTTFELSANGKKLLLVREKELLVADASPDKSDPKKSQVDLSGWAFAVGPREEWRQMFAEAWRLERDYFYDRGMHGVDWPAVRKKFEPLVARVHDRAELD